MLARMRAPDHAFREYDIRGTAGTDLTPGFAYVLGRALGAFYRSEGVAAVSVGRDARASSPGLRDELCRGLVQSGLRVYDIGLVPTPLLYFSLFHLSVGGGVMITGSHNPPDENGFKVCLGRTTVYGETIQRIKDIFARRDFIEGDGERLSASLQDVYVAALSRGLARKPGSRTVRVVVDAGNGTGNIVAPELYRRMGHEVVELHSEPDPTFPHHHPDPTVPENLRDLVCEVARRRAELGIAFDGDADRIGVVTEDGDTLWGDQLLILFARDILARHPGAKVIGEVKCSATLFDEVRRAGGEPIMWKVGHSLIKAKLKEEGALLAGEMSGHIFFADAYYGYDDAIYAGARLLELLSSSRATLQALARSLPRTYATPEIRIPCPDAAKRAVVERLARDFARDYEVNTLDGARISFPGGWALVRASNTQPVLVIRCEADGPDVLGAIEAEVGEAVANALRALASGAPSGRS